MNDRRLSLRVLIAMIAVAVAGLLTRGTAAPTSDGRIAYSNNTTTPQSNPYAVSTNSFGASANPALTAGQSWFVIRASPTRSESIAAYVTGTTLYVTRWDGSAWQPAFNVAGPTVTGRWFDVAYETISGNAIVVYSNNSTAPALAYRTWNGTAWSAAATRASNRTAQMVNWVKLAPHPTTNAVALAFSDTAQYLSALIWDGAAWGNEPAAAHETLLSRSVTSGDYDTFDLAYENSGALMLVWGSENATYNDARYVRFTTLWSAINEVANLGVVPAHVSLAADPGSDNVLLAFSGDAGSSQLYGSRWNGAAWSAPTLLNNVGGAPVPVGSAASRRPFSTAWLTSGTTKVGIVPYSTSKAAATIDYFYCDAATATWSYGTAWTPGGAAIGVEQWLRVVRDPSGSDTAMVTFSDAASDLWAKRVVLSPGPVFTWTSADGGVAITTALANLSVENFSFAYARLILTLTVGNGTDPASGTVCPGSPATPLDAFVLQTNAGTDTVTAVTVAFAAGTWNGISSVEITNDSGATVYGSATPAGDSVTVTLTTNIVATTTATQYKVRIVPKTHAAMPPRPGSSYVVTGTVTSLASTYTKTYGDTSSATLTIDNLSPSEAAWGANTAGNASIILNWTNPTLDFFQVVIVRKTATPIADAPTEGGTYTVPGSIGTSTIVYVGNLQTFTDTSVTNGTTYYYKVFARDPCGNYSSGLESGALSPQAPILRVRALPGSGIVDSCTQITISAPFNGDAPTANNTVTFDRATAIGGPWTAVCANVGTGNPRTCTASALTAGTTYYFRVTFTDPDGVDGQNPQIVGPFTTPSSCVSAATTAGSASARVSSCGQITVTAPFTGDGNTNGSTKVEFNTTNTWPGTSGCATVGGSSPRQCLVTGLTASTVYYVRVTITDPDLVAGTNPQVIGPLTTTACAADKVAPMVLFLAPARNAVMGGTDRVKVQVWDSGGLAVTNPVQWSADGGALSTAVTINANYGCGTACAVYEFDFNTSALANGGHYLTVQATDAAGNVAQTTQAVVVNNSGGIARGGGTNLRRTHGSELCIDCHALATHSSQMTSAKYGNWAVDCLTCHTPHKTRNIALIRESVETPNSGKQTVVFQQNDKAGGTNPQLSHLGDYSGPLNTPYNDGVCESCHTKTSHYRNDTSGGDHTHNQTTRCAKCHEHTKGFRGAGGDCRGCHGTQTQGPRRPVDADFGLQSHHAGNGATMGGTLTNFDCVVCHAEGTVVAGQTETTAYHQNGIIDLKDADTPTTVYSYDKGAVATSAGAAGNWNSSNAAWRTQTSTALDPFCLSCHDSNGASGSSSFGETGATAQNPFLDAAITNNYDQMTRPAITDIKSKIAGAPPAQGTFARHAIRGQSTSIYTKYTLLGGTDQSIYERGSFTSMGTDEGGKPNWNDTSVMGCADCHTVDGANTTAGNAHGSTSEYLLKDASGTATEGTLGTSYVCYRCHSSTSYSPSNHTGGSNFIDSVTQVGPARTTVGNGTRFGIACMNCHGGAPGNNDGTNGYGWIHGTNQVFNKGAGGLGGTRNAYRFTNGGGLRFYDPGTWITTSATCYTLGTADSWSSCTQHSGGRGYTRPFTRPLTY